LVIDARFAMKTVADDAMMPASREVPLAAGCTGPARERLQSRHDRERRAGEGKTSPAANLP
jgi:hypothetical protein